ncbi:MAG: radical SAM protein [Anaerolineae bacterium]
MVYQGIWEGKPFTISIKPNCVTVSIDEPLEADVFSFDMEGRPWTAFIDGISYRRGLDGRLLAKWRRPGDERERRWLIGEEAAAIEERARSRIEALVAAIHAGQAVLHTPLPPEADALFARAIAFDRARSQEDAARYRAIYSPVGILPPDQYMAVVLQATVGCSFNTCTFCTFYKDWPFRIKTPEEFRTHALAVREFLGEGLSLRRTVFLGDANALVIPMPRLVPLMEIAREVYDVDALGGIYAFLDGFSGERKSEQDYARLHELGLQRVYIGLESGSDALLRFLRKPGQAADAVKAVRALKAGGVAVGVIILLGAGGKQYAQQHIQQTIEVLNAMRLDWDDIIYFSEMVTTEDMPYAQDAFQAGLIPLSHEECVAQQEQIEAALHFSAERGTPHISRYDIREFVY